MNHAVVVGRGLNYANAYEFAIKLMETCYVIAERFSSADFLHGPIAMVERGFPAFLFAPSGPTLKSIRELLGKLNKLGAETLVISSEKSILENATKGFGFRAGSLKCLHRSPTLFPHSFSLRCLLNQRGSVPTLHVL